MLVDVVPLRREGVKLSPEELKAAVPTRGHLRLGAWMQSAFAGREPGVRYEASLLAGLEDRTGGLLPALQDAVITKIPVDGDALLIAGTESVRIGNRTQTYGQTWWCRVLVAASR